MSDARQTTADCVEIVPVKASGMIARAAKRSESCYAQGSVDVVTDVSNKKEKKKKSSAPPMNGEVLPSEAGHELQWKENTGR